MIDSALNAAVHDMLTASIVVGPALGSVGVGGLDPQTYRWIENAAQKLAVKFCPNPTVPQYYRGLEVDTAVIETCLIETLSGTAAYLSHLRLGHLSIDETMVCV